MYYTGVGGRATPQYKLLLMGAIAAKMASFGFLLRSGGADGADTAFESAAGKSKEIYYADNYIPYSETARVSYDPLMFQQAQSLSGSFHPAWGRCSPYAKKLHGRNSFQILGPNLNDLSQYCICWTPDGCISHDTRTIKTGGTGTAISIADHYNVPIINLARPDQCQIWSDWARTI